MLLWIDHRGRDCRRAGSWLYGRDRRTRFAGRDLSRDLGNDLVAVARTDQRPMGG